MDAHTFAMSPEELILSGVLEIFRTVIGYYIIKIPNKFPIATLTLGLQLFKYAKYAKLDLETSRKLLG